ncbi:hypothetical protein CHUAL_002037 [Chamberlinius hualienensis]
MKAGAAAFIKKSAKVVNQVIKGRGNGSNGWDNFNYYHPLPGPTGFPVLGHLPLIDSVAPHLTLNKWARIYGPVYKLKFGLIPAVVLSDPSIIAQAFSKPQSTGRPPLFVTTGIMEGNGIISVDGALWKEQRRMVIHCLRQLEDLKTAQGKSDLDKLIEENVDSIVEKFGRHGESTFDVHPLIRFVISNMMSKIVFGRSYSEDDSEYSRQLDLCDMGSNLVQMTNWVNYFPGLRHVFHFHDAYEALKSSKTEHHEFLMRILQQQIYRKRDSPSAVIDFYIKEMFKNEYNVDDPATRNQMIHLLADVFGSASDTIKLTLKWALLHLVARPDIQEKVQYELDSVVGRGRNPTIDDMFALPYTTATVLEANRMANVTPLGLPHWTLDDMPLSYYLIPKGTMIISLLYAVHMDPNYWQCPVLFMPERFLDESRNVVKPFQFMPYSYGQRNCFGEHLAEKTLFLLIAHILHRFTLEYPTEGEEPDFRPMPGFTVSPRIYKLKAIHRPN